MMITLMTFTQITKINFLIYMILEML